MAGSVFDRASIRNFRNSSKAQYDINGVTKASVMHRGHRSQAMSEEIVTEGDRQLQELLRTQLNTNVSVDQVLKRKKEFAESAISYPSLRVTGGTLTADSYSRCVERNEEMESLRQAGLSEEEMRLHLQVKKNPLFVKRNRLCSDPSVLVERLKEIERKLDKHRRSLEQPTKFSGAKTMSRQEMDLERAITKNREKTKQYGCLVASRSNASIEHPSHPINHLGDILEYISSRSSRKAKCRSSEDAGVDSEKKFRQDEASGGCESEKDEDSADEIVRENFDVPNRPVVSMTLLPDGTRAIEGGFEEVPEDVIRRFRLTLEEIGEIPRFRGYVAGDPSSTIYLKNLSSRVSELDLVALFNRFQKRDEPKIVYRLLKGRMKGQAFVKFSDVESASAALNLVNGYNFKGKPIIIQFGKQNIDTTQNGNSEAERND